LRCYLGIWLKGLEKTPQRLSSLYRPRLKSIACLSNKIRNGATRLWHSVILPLHHYEALQNVQDTNKYWYRLKGSVLKQNIGIVFRLGVCLTEASDGCSNRWCTGTVSSLQNK
jgi:hypothetical protein